MNRLLPTRALVLALSLTVSCLGSSTESVEQLIIQGDVPDQKFQPAEALKSYLPAEKLEPKNVDLLLRIARQYRHLMADATPLDEKLKFAGIGKSYAERAAALAPNDCEAYLSVAISYAKMVPILGTKEKLEASRCVKNAVDKTLALDPKQDLAWHLLGCWHQRLAEIGVVKRTVARLVYGKLPDASYEEAVKCLKKAIELNPDRLIHHIELGRTYAQMGLTTEARRCIERGLAMPDVGKDDPEAKARGRGTLAQLQ